MYNISTQLHFTVWKPSRIAERKELMKNIINRLFDENDSEPIVLYFENGEAISFDQIALILLQSEVYVILQPLVPLAGMAKDDALVFKITVEDGEGVLVVEYNNDVIDAVFAEYYKLLGENNADGNA